MSLREDVARAMTPLMEGSQEDKYGRPMPDRTFDDVRPDWQESYMRYADAAIAVVVERCAEVAETAPLGIYRDADHMRTEVAKDIRALATPANNPDSTQAD